MRGFHQLFDILGQAEAYKHLQNIGGIERQLDEEFFQKASIRISREPKASCMYATQPAKRATSASRRRARPSGGS